MDNFYDLEARSLKGETVKFSDLKGKAVLVVNTASKCGLTPQYEQLEELYKRNKDDGLVILGFPCNQFANQEPGGRESIEETCYMNYGVTFPMFDKIEVNGPNAHPVFRYLKDKLPGVGGKAIKWNFTKFLIDREGNPVQRFAPTMEPLKFESTVKKVLGQE